MVDVKHEKHLETKIHNKCSKITIKNGVRRIE